MKRCLLISSLIALFAFTGCGPTTSGGRTSQLGKGAERRACETVAADWLRYVDAGEYAQSWGLMSTAFRNDVGPDEWAGMVGTVRIPLGRMVARRKLGSSYAEDPVGLPEGAYVVISYTGRYSRRLGTGEFISCRRDEDGRWRVFGYAAAGGQPFDASLFTPEQMEMLDKQWLELDEADIQ